MTQTALSKLLDQFNIKSQSKREKGNSFERLVIVFLQEDKTYSPQFSSVATYAEWAQARGEKESDIGIDLVAKNSDDDKYTAIQCKFYDADSSISKKGIDSFIAASDRAEFNRRIFVDTTNKGITDNLQTQLDNSETPFTRIDFKSLENSSIDWEKYLKDDTVVQRTKKSLRPHQQDALDGVTQGLSTADRGKLIMACGTGKTYTALKIAETLAGENKSVLFLVPSLALMSQSITEWSIETDTPLRTLAVCSDTKVGKRGTSNDDLSEFSIHDLAYPATTNAKKLADEASRNAQHQHRMTVVFATYQSIAVLSEAQKNYQLAEFDLIICDEAHRTTGASLANEEESSFVRVHDQDFLKGRKRIYMTATPRVYLTKIVEKAKEVDAKLYSMDDEEKFGKELYVIRFGEAVEKNLLSDYKVIILALDEAEVSADIQKRLSTSSELTLDYATKILGCYKALAKQGINDTEDQQPMHTAVAFCQNIKSSELFTKEFQHVVNEYLSRQNESADTPQEPLECVTHHVDGTMNTAIRNNQLNWLRESDTGNQCRILSNVRCLSEGVDLPSLDAVLFVHPRKAKIDIVQSVGRVMRKAEGKNLGYVILPIGIPAQEQPSEALKKNKNYEVIWDVLNALRSHDERLDSQINTYSLEGTLPNSIEVVSFVDRLPSKSQQHKEELDIGGGGDKDSDNDSDGNSTGTSTSSGDGKGGKESQPQAGMEFDSVQQAIFAKIVDKCGQRHYWSEWANSVGDIARKYMTRINTILADTSSEEYQAFQAFLEELQTNINSAISHDDVVEMLAQHSITKPVFDAVFGDYNFTQKNPVSQSVQKVFDTLEKHQLEKEANTLERFYDSIKRRAQGIQTAEGKQKIIIELYDKFFKTAFPKMAERLGIVYTPVECVDFIIRSVNDLLISEFDQSLADKNVHIIDPFTGTGTFITRLLQSELIARDKLAYKYSQELHANEIVLLAYYIASINIEATYHSIMQPKEYQPFEGICLTDTFQLYENDGDLITPQLQANNARRKRQKALDIKVIIGNPPYSAGQASGNDNNQNISYRKLDTSIERSYAKRSSAALKNSLYDSYIRAIRWASDRIGDNGIIGFITNAGWIESNASDGMRKTLKEEFSSIYTFHLRGLRGLRTAGERAKREGGQIFGQGSGAAIAISIFVKNAQATTQGNIYFHDIGDYLDREQKLNIIKDFASIKGITEKQQWRNIIPDKYHDWLNQRDDSFYSHIPMGDKKDKTKITIFENYSNGLKTNRDAWVYNASKSKLASNVQRMIDFYNQELQRYNESEEKRNQPKDKKEAEKYIANCVRADSLKIAFSRDYRYDIFDDTTKKYQNRIIPALYRPYTKVNAYYDGSVMMELYKMPKIFPEAGLNNLVIGVSGRGANSFTCLASNFLIDLQLLFNGQCFPLYLYEPVSTDNETEQKDSFQQGTVVTAESGKQYHKKDAITDQGLQHFTNYYQDTSISKEDLFYYIYGLLHSPDYRQRFANNLSKDLPHIPRVKQRTDFQLFAQAGRALADLHLHYETKEQYPVGYKQGKASVAMMSGNDFYVEKMRFAKKEDTSIITYNPKITITGIPVEAYNYIVNGKPAIEWVMERQGITTHKDSQISNNANDWAQETMNKPKYPLELLLRVITISLESVHIINSLPALNISKP